MKLAIKILGPLALALTVVPPLMFMFHGMAGPLMKDLMLAGCILWFATARFFMPGGAK